ncbi:hypothetical protein PVK06_012472 [Gossypium arboreum]|uniref:Uncharacterized protein n=1 Tax=Gossypium arboreum TaxID=29729 RepID=A0ABR0QBZ9_GOSAR|nr:hypothetical protein PVK06_012472 [Gossypium arboreum]
MYYLFQKFLDKFKKLSGDDSNVMEMALGVLISLLKSMAFSRDCFVAAGVSFFVAFQVCLSDQELGMFIIEGIFGQIVSISCTRIRLAMLLAKFLIKEMFALTYVISLD